MRTWIKNPLAVLADNAGGGLVVDKGVIADLVPAGKFPKDACQHGTAARMWRSPVW